MKSLEFHFNHFNLIKWQEEKTSTSDQGDVPQKVMPRSHASKALV